MHPPPSRCAAFILSRPFAAAAGLGLAAAVWTGPGRAEPVPGVDVRWTAPAPCPRAEEVQARVRHLLGDAGGGSSSEDPISADGTVTATKGHYRLLLRIRKERPPVDVIRVFESDTCESVAGAAEVTLVLLARGGLRLEALRSSSGAGSTGGASPGTDETPPAADRPSAPPPTPAAPGVSPSAPAPLATRSPPPVDAASTTTRGAGAARTLAIAFEAPVLAIDEGTLPTWAYGVGVGVGLHVRRFRANLRGLLWLPQSGAGSSVFQGSYTRRSGALSGCYGVPIGPFDLGPCVTLALEDVTAAGTGPQVVSAEGHATWLTTGAAFRAGWAPGNWVSFFLRPSVTFSLSHPTFAIDGVGPLYRVPLVAAGMDVGCEWIL